MNEIAPNSNPNSNPKPSAPAAKAKTAAARKRTPFEQVALLLQGGGALGAYQGGVYQALAEAGLHPDWVAGISIGAINSAIIAGNPPELRVERLRDLPSLELRRNQHSRVEPVTTTRPFLQHS